MNYTKSQVSNFLDDKILFRFVIPSDFIIEFDVNEELFTFEELGKIIANNFGYWNSIYDVAPNNFKSEWENLKNRYNTIKTIISELEELNIDSINNQIYHYLTNSHESKESGIRVHLLSLDSPIDEDIEFWKIRKFVSFYIQQTQNSLDEAIENFIYLQKTIIISVAIFQAITNIKVIQHSIYLEKNFQILKKIFLILKQI